MTIGQRAVQAIKEEAEAHNVSFEDECAALDIERTVVRGWRKGTCNPASYYLSQMARNGYDIMWILLGDEK